MTLGEVRYDLFECRFRRLAKIRAIMIARGYRTSRNADHRAKLRRVERALDREREERHRPPIDPPVNGPILIVWP